MSTNIILNDFLETTHNRNYPGTSSSYKKKQKKTSYLERYRHQVSVARIFRNSSSSALPSLFFLFCQRKQ